MKPTSEYFMEKLQFKYGDHPRVDPDDIERTAKILCTLDEKLDAMSFSYNQNYISIEKLTNPQNRKICIIDFMNQTPRIFYNLDPEEFEAFDEKGRMEIFNYANFVGRPTPAPFFNFDNRQIDRIVPRRDEYFTDVAIAVHNRIFLEY